MGVGMEKPTLSNRVGKNNLLLNSNYSISDKELFINTLFKDTDGYIEVREITDKSVKTLFFNSPEELLNYDLPKDKNVYVGMYSRKVKGKGTAENCKTTQVLWADLDNISREEVQERLRVSGLPYPSIIVSSGHGYHIYWVLNKRVGNEAKTLLKGISNRIGSDGRVSEIARCMRLPGTYNVKDKPVKCQIIEYNSKVYSIDEISRALNITLKGSNKPNKTYYADYEGLISNTDYPCIKSILKGVNEGQRNWALGRLTKHLQVKGYTRKKAELIVLEWNIRNNPPENIDKIKRDFTAYWLGDYKLLGCKIPDIQLQGVLNMHCNKLECPVVGSISELVIDNAVPFNNRIFNEYQDLTGNDLLIYGLLLAKPQGMDTRQLRDELYSRGRKKVCMSRPTMNNSINQLKRKGLIEVVKKAGRATFCKAKKQGTYGMGYTLVSNGALNGLIDGRITPEQFKLYVLLLKYAYGKGEAYPTVITLGNHLGVKHNAVSNHLKEMEQNRFIERFYEVTDRGNEKLKIRLLV